MRRARRILSGALLTLCAAACGRGTDAPPASNSRSDVSAPPRSGDEGLTVNERGAVMRVHGAWRDIEVPFTFVNRRSTPVSNPGCNPPEQPRLEWWTGASWQSAYLQGSDACRSRSFIVAAGARHTDTLTLRVPLDSIDASGAPTGEPWRVPPDAWFRLVWDLREPPTDPSGWEDGPPIAERERVSAPFRLRAAIDTTRADTALPNAARDVVAFLRGRLSFDRLHVADSVTFHVAPEGGGARVTRAREVLRDPRAWSVPVRGGHVALAPPDAYRRQTAFAGQHVACTPMPLRDRFPELAAMPHIGVRLDAGESASCLGTWNVTLVFARDTTVPRLAAVVYDQWEW